MKLSKLTFGVIATLTSVAYTLPSLAQDRAVNYRIIVRTKVNDSWTDGHGTDNFIDMTMHGETGKKKLELQGSHEAGDTDSFTYATKDIGVIQKITVDVSGDLADKWAPLDIKILRATDSDAVEGADGWSSFFIDKELDYDPVVFAATKISPKAITVSADGEIIDSSLTQTFVNFANNLSSPDSQSMMNVTESWKEVRTVGVSESKVTSFGGSYTLSYEYEKGDPATGKHKFGASAQQSWSKAIGKVQSKSDSYWTASEFNWKFDVPRNTFLFRKITFKVPRADQIYKDSLGQSFAIRSLSGKIAPLPNAGEILAIPQINRHEQVVPVSMSLLENNFIRHMKIKDVQFLFRDHIGGWIDNGWLKEDSVYQNGATGENVQQVIYGRQGARTGRYINTQGKKWVSQSLSTGKGFSFVETNRDAWSVYLTDKSRGVDIQLNLHTRKVMYRDKSAPNYREINRIFSAAN